MGVYIFFVTLLIIILILLIVGSVTTIGLYFMLSIVDMIVTFFRKLFGFR